MGRIIFVLLLIVILLALSLLVGIRVNLEQNRTFITDLVADTLGIELVINGDIELNLSLSPSFLISKVQIPNPDAWPYSNLLSVDRVQAKLSVLPFLQKVIDIDLIELEGLSIDVIHESDGTSNLDVWLAGLNNKQSKSVEASKQTQSSINEREELAQWALSFDYDIDIKEHIQATAVAITYRDVDADAVVDWRLNQLTLIAIDSNEVELSAEGSMLGESYSLDAVWHLNALLHGQASHISANFKVADATLSISGDLALDARQQSTLDLVLDWPEQDSLIRILGPQFEPLSPLNISGKLLYKPGTIALPSVDAIFGLATAKGEMSLSRGKVPKVTGHLNVDRIDVSHWLQGGSVDQAASQKERISSTAKTEQQTPVLQILKSSLEKSDLDIKFELGELLGLGFETKQLSLAAMVKDGKLVAPSTVTIEGVTFNGIVKAQGGSNDVDAQVRLFTNDADLSKMVSKLDLLASEGDSIQLASSEFLMNLKGQNLQEIVGEAHLEFHAIDGLLQFASGTKMQLHNVDLISDPKDNFSAQIDGDILGIPLSVAMQSPALQKIQNERWLLDIQMMSPAFELSGEVELPEGDWNNSARVNMELSSQNVGALSAWLGINPEYNSKFEFSANYQLEPGKLNIDIERFQLGDNQGQLTWLWDASSQDNDIPDVTVDADFSFIDIDQLMGLMPAEDPEQSEAAAASQANSPKAGTLQIPLLPNGLYLGDLDLKLKLDRLLVSGQSLEQLNLQAKAREGWMQKSPFSLEYLGSAYAGEFAFDLRESPLKMAVQLQSQQLNLGYALSKLDLVADLDMVIDRASLRVILTGDNLKELILNTEFDLAMNGGYWVLVDQNTGAQARLSIDNGSLKIAPSSPLRLNLDGKIQDSNYNVALQSLNLTQLSQQPKSLPLSLIANLDDVKIEASAQLERPIRADAMSLSYKLEAPRMNSLDHLHPFQLPPFGPLKSSGTFELTAQGYEIKDFQFSVDESRLLGNATLRTDLAVPELFVGLDAQYIQLDDFEFGDWRPLDVPSVAVEEQVDIETSQEVLVDDTIKDRLAAINAQLEVNVAKVEVGTEHLGAGQLKWQLLDSKMDLHRLYVELPGGEVELSAGVKPSSQGFDSYLKADIEKFDYGLLARKLKPTTQMAGLLDLKLDLLSSTQDVYGLLSGASGQLGFAVWPENFEAGVIDLWAVSLVSAVMPKMDTDISLVNCVVASFDMSDGLMRQDVLLADTSKIRILGESTIDFKAQELALRLAPKPKTAQIFNLQTPVSVSGSFEDFKIGVASGGLIGTTLRFITSPVVAPLSWIFTAPLEQDGSQLCQQVWQASLVTN
ncbi:AsmA family protein [Alginatibacterium sediminis]|uniref:AsmA family protein n=1 Tax=Alginatibacterium sediminis TaxID=2164068 RepID=UPI0022785784|nr:AsmA family protein [Alginatibacterium sediminis]